MKTEQKIIAHIKKHGVATSKDISGLLGISRQAVNKHLKKLIQNAVVLKEGSTRGAHYRLHTGKSSHPAIASIKQHYSLSHIEEDRVLQQLSLRLNLRAALNANAYAIASYAFTEMLNNAIDHSKSRTCAVEMKLDQYNLSFRIRDFGIGVFHSIFRKFDLPDEYAAIGELIKGKTTTMAERHTGEGIFFTSKAADCVSFRSHQLNLIFDNRRKDLFVEEKRALKGTEVTFNLARNTRRKLNAIFAHYAPEEFDYKFEKTRVRVGLFYHDYVSRSEAKRLLIDLDKFREIVLDFAKVKSIGQGFADEIFRVFQHAHPEIRITTVNLSPSLEPVIRHVVGNTMIRTIT